MVLHYTLWGWHVFLLPKVTEFFFFILPMLLDKLHSLKILPVKKYNIRRKNTLHWYNYEIERKMMYLTPILLTVFLCPTVVKIQNSFLTYINKFLILNPTSKRKVKKTTTTKLMCSYFGVLRVCDEVNITKHAFGRLLLDPVLFCSTIYIPIKTFIFCAVY